MCYRYVCLPPAGIPLQVLASKCKSMLEKKYPRISVAMDKSVLQQVHLETSVSLYEIILEHLKECGRG